MALGSLAVSVGPVSPGLMTVFEGVIPRITLVVVIEDPVALPTWFAGVHPALLYAFTVTESLTGEVSAVVIVEVYVAFVLAEQYVSGELPVAAPNPVRLPLTVVLGAVGVTVHR
jgi:hypothetical protein